MDRNLSVADEILSSLASLSARRAWIEMFLSMGLDGRFKSLSARRAWIEISGGVSARRLARVALRKESVDRNCRYPARCVGLLSSLSARRAWIEIDAYGAECSD